MIAYRPAAGGKGPNIPNQVIDIALTRHPDGYGLAWREDGKISIAKFGPQQRKLFRRTLKRLDRIGLEYAAHFRQATHGPAVQSLAHPFTYEDPNEGTVAVLHNGVIDIATEPHESDTQVFARDVLAHLPSAWWRTPALRYLVSGAIGWSKLVVMTVRETVIIAEGSGEWDGGLWYSSNHRGSYKYTPKATYNGKAWNDYLAEKEAAKATAATAASALIETPMLAGTGDLSHPLRHGGHTLSLLASVKFDRDGDWPSSVVCDVCYTVGDLYVIDGAYYPDLAHRSGALAAPDDVDEDLLPERSGMDMRMH